MKLILELTPTEQKLLLKVFEIEKCKFDLPTQTIEEYVRFKLFNLLRNLAMHYAQEKILARNIEDLIDELGN